MYTNKELIIERGEIPAMAQDGFKCRNIPTGIGSKTRPNTLTLIENTCKYGRRTGSGTAALKMKRKRSELLLEKAGVQ